MKIEEESNLLLVTYRVQQFLGSYWAGENGAKTPEASFNKFKIWRQ